MYQLIAISSPELSDLMAALARSYAQWRRAPGFQNALLMHPCSFDLHTVEARGGDTLISSYGDYRRIFLGLNFL